MGQAKPEDQILPGIQLQCSIEPDLGGDVLLSAIELHQFPDEAVKNDYRVEHYDPGSDDGKSQFDRYLVVISYDYSKSQRAN